MTISRILHGLACLPLLLSSAGCELSEQSGEGGLAGSDEVRLDLYGFVEDATRPGQAIGGAEVFVVQLADDGGREPVGEPATADQDGFFDLAEVTIKPYEHRYRLVVEHGDYLPNDGTIVYALISPRDPIDLGVVRLVPRTPITVHRVTGAWIDGLDDAPIEGAVACLRALDDDADEPTDKAGEVIAGQDPIDVIEDPDPAAEEPADPVGGAARCGADEVACEATAEGFSCEAVPTGRHLLTGRAEGYVPEAQVVEVAGRDEPLGNVRMFPASDRRDVTVVLDWQRPGGADYDLDLHLTLVDPATLVNDLGGPQIEVSSAELLTRPGYGYGRDTAYWPQFLGGQREGGGRVDVGLEGELIVGEEAIVKHHRDDLEGDEPEVLTFFQRLPYAATERLPGYGYPAAAGTRFPLGMAAVRVDRITDDGRTIYDAAPVLTVYAGDQQVGRFGLGEFAARPSESTPTWTPVLIEYGVELAPGDEPGDDSVYFEVHAVATRFDQSELPLPWAYRPEEALPVLESAVAVGGADGVSIAGLDAEQGGPVLIEGYRDTGNSWWFYTSDLVDDWSLPGDFEPTAIGESFFGLDLGGVLGSGSGYLADQQQACPVPNTLFPLGDVLFVGTNDGLRVAVDCEDTEHPGLTNAPTGAVLASGTLTEASPPLLLVGGEFGLRATALDSPIVDWSAELPAGAPRDVVVTAIRDGYVGTEDGVVWAYRGGEAGWVELALDSFDEPVEARIDAIAVVGGRAYAATEVGLFRELTADENWGDAALSQIPSLPAAPVQALAASGDELVAVIEGRTLLLR